MIKKITQIEEEVKLFMPSSKEEVDVFKIKYLDLLTWMQRDYE